MDKIDSVNQKVILSKPPQFNTEPDSPIRPNKPVLGITIESEVRGYVRTFPTVFDKAQGSILTDTQGKEFIDFFCGAGSLNYGHNNPNAKKHCWITSKMMAFSTR